MFLIASSLLRRRSLRSNSIFQTISRCRQSRQRDCLIKKRSLSPAFRYQLKAILSLILLSSYISCSYCALFFSSNAAISQALKKRCQNMSLFQFSSSSISPMFLNRYSNLSSAVSHSSSLLLKRFNSAKIMKIVSSCNSWVVFSRNVYFEMYFPSHAFSVLRLLSALYCPS